MAKRAKQHCETCGARNRDVQVITIKDPDPRMPKSTWVWCVACRQAYERIRKREAA